MLIVFRRDTSWIQPNAVSFSHAKAYCAKPILQKNVSETSAIYWMQIVAIFPLSRKVCDTFFYLNKLAQQAQVPAIRTG